MYTYIQTHLQHIRCHRLLVRSYHLKLPSFLKKIFTRGLYCNQRNPPPTPTIPIIPNRVDLNQPQQDCRTLDGLSSRDCHYDIRIPIHSHGPPKLLLSMATTILAVPMESPGNSPGCTGAPHCDVRDITMAYLRCW